MRTHGTLVKWNDDRGFGLIEPATGAEVLFVHISAFPRDGVRPRIGELVSFETEMRGDGKRRAMRVMRPGSRATAHHPHRTRPTSTRQSPVVTLLAVLIVGAFGWFGYTQFHKSNQPSSRQIEAATLSFPAAPAQTFACDGRTRCSQMTSCAEANFFIKQCPGTQMDGDGDGVACESQWCAD